MDYTTRVCSSNNSYKYLPFSDVLPTEQDNGKQELVRAPKGHPLQKLLVVEIMLICCVYSIVKPLVAAGSFGTINPHTLLNSHTKAPYYLIIQGGAGCLWVLFAILTISKSGLSSDDIGFMCGFNVRRLGNVQRFTVQCMEQGGDVVYTAFMVNFGLCIVLAITKFVHIVSTFLIQPFLSKSSVAASLVESGIIKNPKQVGVGFAMSDLHFAMVTNGGDLRFDGTKAEEKGNLMLNE